MKKVIVLTDGVLDARSLFADIICVLGVEPFVTPVETGDVVEFLADEETAAAIAAHLTLEGWDCLAEDA